MRKSKPPEVRQLEQLLREKLIPLAQNGAPLVLFDTPPRCSQPLPIRQMAAAPLAPLKKKTSYPQIQNWRKAAMNAITVPVLGCIFEGEVDYNVRTPPGQPGRRWIVPMRQGTLFLVKPGIPFTSGKMPPESPAPQNTYARGVLMHLRHDGVRCHTYTIDKGRAWGHPYLFLYQREALPLGEKLLEEMQQMQHPEQPIAYHYWLLILHLLLRSIEQERFACTSSRRPGLESEEADPLFSPPLTSRGKVRLAEEYIQNHVSDPGFRHTKIAEHCGLSARHLARLFQSQQGMSLSDYTTRQKLNKACELLASSRIPIGEVAAYCGFRRLSNFSNWFALQQNCSPSEYRNERQQ